MPVHLFIWIYLFICPLVGRKCACVPIGQKRKKKKKKRSKGVSWYHGYGCGTAKAGVRPAVTTSLFGLMQCVGLRSVCVGRQRVSQRVAHVRRGARAMASASLYDVSANDINGQKVDMGSLKGKVLLITNVASR